MGLSIILGKKDADKYLSDNTYINDIDAAFRMDCRPE